MLADFHVWVNPSVRFKSIGSSLSKASTTDVISAVSLIKRGSLAATGSSAYAVDGDAAAAMAAATIGVTIGAMLVVRPTSPARAHLRPTAFRFPRILADANGAAFD